MLFLLAFEHEDSSKPTQQDRGQTTLVLGFRQGGGGSIQPIYVDDVVEGILAAARRGRTGEAYILAGNEVVTLKDYFVGLAHAVGKDHMRSIPAWLALGLARACELVAAVGRNAPVFTRQEVRLMLLDATYDAGKARRELGFEQPCR
jgi:nucleoside-diphosphate-sugar epimerase